MIKIGQIGIGHNHGHEKMTTVQKFPELFEVVGYAEENEEWIRRRGEKPGYVNLPRMSIDEVIEKSDAILVETDVWNLTEIAQKCIDAGKHIHMDKPASGTLSEYKHLLDTAKEKGLVVQMGYMYRYNPAILKTIEMIKNGQLGKINGITAEMSVRHADSYRQWLKNFQGGDMYIFGSHLIDLIVYIMGKPKRVLSSIVPSGVNGVNAPDLTAAILEYENAQARVYSSSLEWDGWARRCFSVAGELGTVQIQPIEAPTVMTFAPLHPGKTYAVQAAQPVEVDEVVNTIRYDEMMKDFYAYIKGTKENPFTYEHDYMVQEVLDAACGGIKCLGKELQ